MPRPRSLLAVLAALLVPAAVAIADPTPSDPSPPALSFHHDASKQTFSGFYAGDDGDDSNGNALQDRYADTYETFEIDLPDGSRHGSLTAQIQWADARVDLDLYVYRLRDDGTPEPVAVAKSTGSKTARRASETAAYQPGTPVPAGRYLVVVDNVCSNNADPDPRTPGKTADCHITPPAQDEDDFTGTVELGNELPSVTLSGPDTAVTSQTVNFHADASDRDGEITGYFFDLDGDGTYERDSDGSSDVSAAYKTAGTRTVRVQVTDDSGNVGYASHAIKITKAPVKPKKPLTLFKLNRTSFGGAGDHSLVVSYRLREKARVSMSLRRHDKTVRRIAAGVRKRNRTYKLVLRPTHLKPGTYGIRLTVRGASGQVQVALLKSHRW